MKKVLLGTAVIVTVLAAAQRFGPRLAERGMAKCQQMMQQRGGGAAQMSARAPGQGEASLPCAS